MDKTAWRSTNFIAGAGLGAMLMYLLDKPHGRRRIALAQDQVVHWARCSRDLVNAGVRDLVNRASGLAARVRHAEWRAEPPGNEVLIERVRAQLGRLVSHPYAVHVAADAGCVTLSGPVLKAEEAQLVRGVREVRGVAEVENRLEAYESDENMPALQGGRGRIQPPRMEFMQTNWAPGPRLLAFAAGTALAGVGIARRSMPGGLLGLAGVALAARAASNTEIGRLLGIKGGRRVMEIQKTITIAAPRERVFDLWSNYDNFPHFMSFVEAVHRIDETRSHWLVKGPAGTHVEWDSSITEFMRPQVIAWRSDPGAAVRHAGVVRFDEFEGGTRVTVRMSYSPPGGVVGHSLAALLGRDPKRELDADLMRMKSFIETGVTPHDAAQPAGAHAPESLATPLSSLRM